MKAIPTVYHGIRFRSRLEARWAVWFDALGLTWWYEPPISTDVGYQPDFFVAGAGYVEIKPDVWWDLAGDETAPEVERWERFASAVQPARFFLLAGPPATWEGGVLTNQSAAGWGLTPGFGIRIVQWRECPCCRHVSLREVTPGDEEAEGPTLRLAAEAVRDHSFAEVAV